MRGVLWNMWQEELQNNESPLEAWKSIVENREKARTYKQARGKGIHSCEWDEVLQLVSASLLYSNEIRSDRNVGFSPIPAMSMLSHVW